jgi:integrase
LLPAIEKANEQLAKDGLPLLSEGLTHHSLGRTFASILFAIGRDQTTCMDQMGHATAALTLEVHARRMASRDGELDRLRTLVRGRVLARFGTEADPVAA